MDLSKYRELFLEEAVEHLGEMSRALLRLEKAPAEAEAIDAAFRMAHSIKGMAASLEYRSITDVAHRLEDRLQEVRAAGAVPPGDSLSRLFSGLAALEQMVGHVREHGAAPPAAAELLETLASPLGAEAVPAEKKAPAAGRGGLTQPAPA